MAVNRTRTNHYNQKNKISVFTAEHVDYSWLNSDGGEGSILFVLPPHSIIIHLLLLEEEATNSAAKFDMTVGGIALATNAALDDSNILTAPVLTNVHMEVGGDVIVKGGTSPPTQGIFSFILMYVEHYLHNGEYTNFSDVE